MGVEIECVIENNFNKLEIVGLLSTIDKKWTNLRGFIELESEHFLQPIKKKNLTKKAKWDFDDLTENEIEDYWKYFENENTKNSCPKNEIFFFFCYFGMIKIYRKVIVINPFNLRFKAFRNENDAKKSLVKIVRKIANLFGARKILYCADSSTKTEILSNMAMDGNSLQEIIEFGKLKFGKPNSNYLIAIEETYFIDEGNFEVK